MSDPIPNREPRTVRIFGRGKDALEWPWEADSREDDPPIRYGGPCGHPTESQVLYDDEG